MARMELGGPIARTSLDDPEPAMVEHVFRPVDHDAIEVATYPVMVAIQVAIHG
jgi:hypothetical protein